MLGCEVIQKSRPSGVVRPARSSSQRSVTQAENPLGAGNRDIEKSSLLFKPLKCPRRSFVRKKVLVYPDHEHRRKLKSLGRMNRHEGNFFFSGIPPVLVGRKQNKVKKIGKTDIAPALGRV